MISGNNFFLSFHYDAFIFGVVVGGLSGGSEFPNTYESTTSLFSPPHPSTQ